MVGFGEVRLHGRTSTNGSSTADRWMARGIDSSMPTTGVLLNVFGDHVDILLHTPEADRNFSRIVAAKPRRLWVENDHPRIDGVKKAVKMVTALREKGVCASLMLDFCHAVGADALRNGDFNDELDEVFSYANENLVGATTEDGVPIWQGTHIAVGTNKADAFPIEDEEIFPDSMLKQIENLQQAAGIVTQTIENRNGAFGVPKRRMVYVQERNGVIFERLSKAGIVRKTEQKA